MATPPERPPALALLGLFALSATVLALEVLLLRLFELSHWHHFAGLAIALAVLGLGSAGTVLALLGPRAIALGDRGFLACTALAVLGLLALLWLHTRVALRPLLAATDAAELLRLLAVDLFAFVPFLAAGLGIGQALARWPRAVRRVYGANLLGSGAGSLAASALLAVTGVERALAVLAAALALVALVLALRHAGWRGRAAVALLLGLALAAAFRPPPAAISDFKALAQLRERPGIQVLDECPGLPGRLTVLRSPTLRYAPGLSLGWTEAVPAADAAVIGSDRVVPLPRDYREAAAHARASLAALALRLRPQGPVLALGASDWHTPGLAGGRPVTWVLPDARLLRLAHARGAAAAGVRGVAAAPWRYLLSAPGRPAVISLDGAHAGGDAATEDYLLTVEGLAAALRRLAPGGLLAVPLAERYPPRHFSRLMTTLAGALERVGAERAGDHVAVLRGLQSVLVLASAHPLTAPDREAMRGFGERWRFDLAWLADLRPEEVNRFHRLAAPLYYREADAALTGAPWPEEAGWFERAPATLDQPYFWRTLRWGRIADFVAALGAQAPAFLDWTLLLGALAMVVVTLLAALLILLPLGRLPAAAAPGRAGVAGYFAALGLGYLLAELALFQRSILLLGEPVLAASVVFAVFLVGSGLGSLGAPQRRSARAVAMVFVPVAVGLALAAAALWSGAERLAGAGTGMRVALTAAALAPLAWALGRPLPWALRQLSERGRWIPWAWGINGFASVLAAAGAPLLSVELGQPVTLAAGAACYGVALGVAARWIRAA